MATVGIVDRLAAEAVSQRPIQRQSAAPSPAEEPSPDDWATAEAALRPHLLPGPWNGDPTADPWLPQRLSIDLERDLRPRSVATLSAVMQALDYRVDAVRAADQPVPRLFLAQLPRDLPAMRSPEQRKELFLRSLLPLVLHINEQILAERREVLRIADRVHRGGAIGPREGAWLTALAARYRIPGAVRDARPDFGALLKRVDLVPPSLALAQAAEESGWGTSRVAQASNALFGEMVPTTDGTPPRVRGFARLIDSTRSYIHNLNTHRAYEGFRNDRAALRAMGLHPDGFSLAGRLLRYSERGLAYIANVRAIIRTNRLHEFDRVRLHGPSLPLRGPSQSAETPADTLPVRG